MSDERVTFQRVTADDIRVGDRVARARTHRFRTVRAISGGSVSTVLRFTDNSRAQPHRDAEWWREVPDYAA